MDQFEKDVLEGLSATPRRLSSKYFYDKKGDRLFQAIMGMDEYYLTRAEFEVLENNKEAIVEKIASDESFNLVEFGAGDGSKTRVLLRHLLKRNVAFTYRPIDISANALAQLTEELTEEMPVLQVEGIRQEYFRALQDMDNGKKRKIVLFLGSNIGNFTDLEAKKFLSELHESMNSGDMALIGFDLKKDPHMILHAYDDSEGITAEFNLNLLDRINRELGGTFNRENFMHYALYNPLTGQAKSYIISRKEQTVQVAGSTFSFNAWEAIHTEISRKFDPSETDDLAAALGFRVVNQFFDEGHRFMDVLWEK